MCMALPAHAVAPVGPTKTKIVKLDGVALSAPPSSGRVLAPTFQYDAATQVLHMWVLTADAPSESLTNIRHAVSTDGINFVSTGNMSYAGSPWTGTPWGTQTGEPAMVYPKVAVWNGRYKLFLWTYNAQPGQGPWGDYNYNTSVNDIGLDLNNLVVEHEGPFGPPAGGIVNNNAGPWGAVNDINYFEYNFFIGRSDMSELPPGTPFTPPSTASTGPYRLNGVGTQVMDQVHTLPAPFAPALNCFDAGSPTYYVHNDARVLANPDASLGIIYSIRDCATAARVAPQLFYAESADNGLNWGSPGGIFSGAPVNVDGVPTTGNFALADFFVAKGRRYVYISTTDASGNLVVAGAGLSLPASISVTGGAVQSAAINTAYAAPLAATVRDADDNPVNGAPVTFDLPVSGAGGTFPGAVTTIIVATDTNGVATSPTVTANGTVGAFSATASVTGVVTPGTFSLLNSSGAAFTVIVTPAAPDWAFVTETAPGSATGSFIIGPGTPPAGTGSVQLEALIAEGGELFYTPQFAGMRLDTLKGLQFSTFVAAGVNDLAMDLDVDANLTVPTPVYQGRLVFDPNLLPSAVIPGVWQTWDAYAQKAWYASRAPINALCTPASPCTLQQIITAYPNVGVIAQLFPGAFGWKLGNNHVTGIAAVDKLVMVREGPPATLTAWTFDYEPAPPPPTALIPKAGTPQVVPINTTFPVPPTAEVRDAANQLLAGVTVVFDLPPTGPSGTFPGGVLSATSVTTSAGLATAPVVTANSVAGVYAAAATAGAAPPAGFPLTNAQATTTTALGSSLNPSTFGATVTFTATVAPVVATGTVSFFDGATLLGTGSLSAGMATFAASTLGAGSHSITAVYGGDANYLGSTSPVLTQVVIQVPATITATGGTPQSTPVSTPFGAVLAATVRDASNFVVPGVAVTFTLPASGASGTFPGAALTAIATTDVTGIALSPVVAANATIGSFNATANAAAVAVPATFNLQNLGPAIFQGAVSRMVQGPAGTFDLPLP
jgi:Bacterial Ig-like domain (group 3)